MRVCLLEPLTSLQQLHIPFKCDKYSRMRVRDEVLITLERCLSSLHFMQHLAICNVDIQSKGGEAIASSLWQMSKLRTLDLSGNRLGGEVTKVIAAAMSQLKIYSI